MADVNKAQIKNLPITEEFFIKALKMDLHSINALVVTLIKTPAITQMIGEAMYQEYLEQEQKKKDQVEEEITENDKPNG